MVLKLGVGCLNKWTPKIGSLKRDDSKNLIGVKLCENIWSGDKVVVAVVDVGFGLCNEADKRGLLAVVGSLLRW